MTVEEIVAEMEALIARATSEDGTEGAMSDEDAARYEELERELRKLNRAAEIRSRHAAYLTPVPGARNLRAEDPEKRNLAFNRWIRSMGEDREFRALARTPDAAGGYLVPDEWRDKLVECMRSFGGFINEAEQINTSHGRTMNWGTIDDNDVEAAITPESAAFTGGADPEFGAGSLGAFKYTTLGAGDLPLRVSVELIQDSMIDIDARLRELMGRRIHRREARDAVLGTGVGMPKGILDGTADFTLTTTNAWDQTNNGWQDLVTIETLLDDEYLNNAKWLMNRTTYAQLRTLTDANGRPLIGLGDNGIDQGIGRQRTLLGYPVVIDNFAPNPAAGTNFMAFGDFREAYVWRRVAQLEVIQDPYARKNFGEVEYVAWERAGGTVQNRCAYVIIGGTTV
jgi:HK97 family phage major capsid protein